MLNNKIELTITILQWRGLDEIHRVLDHGYDDNPTGDDINITIDKSSGLITVDPDSDPGTWRVNTAGVITYSQDPDDETSWT